MPDAPPRRSALAGVAPGEAVGDRARLVVRRRPPPGIFRLCAPREPRPFLAAMIQAGRPLPQAPNTTTAWRAGVALWTAPGEWLLVVRDGAVTPAALGGDSGAVADLSHARAVVRVEGSNSADLLTKGCPLDLDLDAFPPGDCRQSVLAHTHVLLHRTAEDVFDLYVPRSYARHVWEWLCAAGAEYGTGG